MKKGFTLVELLTVIVLMALISMISFPVIRGLISSNNQKKYTTYEDLMIEYAKTFPINNYKAKGYICLSELKMKPINDGTTCNGYVEVVRSDEYISHLRCAQNGEIVYETSEFDMPTDCKLGD